MLFKNATQCSAESVQTRMGEIQSPVRVSLLNTNIQLMMSLPTQTDSLMSSHHPRSSLPPLSLTYPVSKCSFLLEESRGCGREEERSRLGEVEPWACISVPLATGPLGREGREWEGMEVEGGEGRVEDEMEAI